MKLRIKGDSLRLRVSKSEVARLLEAGRVEEKAHLGPDESSVLTYVLEQAKHSESIAVQYRAGAIAVSIPDRQVRAWAQGDAVGIYAQIAFGDHSLELAVEKDFACLDRRDVDNQDAFPNPKQPAAC